MLFLISKLFLILIIFTCNANAIEQNWFKKGEYNNWEVFAKLDKDICYAIARPHKMEGKYNIRGRVDVMVALNNNNNKNKYTIGFDFGYYFAIDEKVKLTIDNSSIFELDTFAQTAWVNPAKDPKLHIKVIEAMKKGNVLIAEGTSNRGTETKDTYSLVGFTKAFKKVKDVCK